MLENPGAVAINADDTVLAVACQGTHTYAFEQIALFNVETGAHLTSLRISHSAYGIRFMPGDTGESLRPSLSSVLMLSSWFYYASH